jgi:branched-subunit amino acid ABC-type transport system permease component
MMIAVIPIMLLLILWSVYDIFKQDVDTKYKAMMTIAIVLLALLGIVLYWFVLRPMIKKETLVLKG